MPARIDEDTRDHKLKLTTAQSDWAETLATELHPRRRGGGNFSAAIRDIIAACMNDEPAMRRMLKKIQPKRSKAKT